MKVLLEISPLRKDPVIEMQLMKSYLIKSCFLFMSNDLTIYCSIFFANFEIKCLLKPDYKRNVFTIVNN